MDSSIAALLGALLGGAMTAAGSFAFEWWSDQRKRRNLSIAVAGEVAAMAEMVRRRQYLESVRSMCLDAARGKVGHLQVMLPPELLAVSRSAMQQAGLLRGTLPTLLPRAVMIADAVVSDLNRLMIHGTDRVESAVWSNNPAGAERFYNELFGVLLNALDVGDKLVDEVRRQYPDVQIPLGTLGPLELALLRPTPAIPTPAVP